MLTRLNHIAPASGNPLRESPVTGDGIRDVAADTRHAFPGHGQVRPEQQEVDRLRREVAKLRAERDILEKAAAYFARDAT